MSRIEHPLTRREFLKVSGGTAAVAAATGAAWLFGYRLGLGNESEPPIPIEILTEQELLGKYLSAFDPQQYWHYSTLVINPTIAPEVAYLPSPDRQLDRPTSLDISLSTPESHQTRINVHEVASQAIDAQQLHLPRAIPVLSKEVIPPYQPTLDYGEYPINPALIIIDQSFRKGEVLRLTTQEQISTSDFYVMMTFEVDWIALTKFFSAPPDSLPQTLSYAVRPQNDTHNSQATVETRNATLFLPEEIRLLAAYDLEQFPPAPDLPPLPPSWNPPIMNA